jgi:hypothetical protein
MSQLGNYVKISQLMLQWILSVLVLTTIYIYIYIYIYNEYIYICIYICVLDKNNSMDENVFSSIGII